MEIVGIFTLFTLESDDNGFGNVIFNGSVCFYFCWSYKDLFWCVQRSSEEDVGEEEEVGSATPSGVCPLDFGLSATLGELRRFYPPLFVACFSPYHEVLG